ncbi:MAG: hypothetical protein ABIL68_07220 [bacterium]
MIRNPEKVRRFENELIKNQKADVEKNFKLAEAMYEEAVELGIFPLKDPLEGIEVDIRIAKVVNSV